MPRNTAHRRNRRVGCVDCVGSTNRRRRSRLLSACVRSRKPRRWTCRRIARPQMNSQQGERVMYWTSLSASQASATSSPPPRLAPRGQSKTVRRECGEQRSRGRLRQEGYVVQIVAEVRKFNLSNIKGSDRTGRYSFNSFFRSATAQRAFTTIFRRYRLCYKYQCNGRRLVVQRKKLLGAIPVRQSTLVESLRVSARRSARARHQIRAALAPSP